MFLVGPMPKLEVFGFIVFWWFIIRIILIWLILPLLRYIWIYWIRSNVSQKKIFCPSVDNWAVITGGTDGIGLAYCRHLGQLGYPLLIISRNKEKLIKVQQQLRHQCPQSPEIRIFQFDFSENFNSKQYEQLEQEILQLSNVDLLVNNVGTSFKTTAFFTEISKMDPNFFTSIININIVSVLRMTWICLQIMVKQQRGIIINISSISALTPLPLLSAYSATKAYVDYFTRCLSLEIQDQYPNNQIMIQSILPGFVSTKMSKKLPSRWVPSADNYVGLALKSVGHTDRSSIFWLHCIQATANHVVNHLLGPSFYASLVFRYFLSIRRKFYHNQKMKIGGQKS